MAASITPRAPFLNRRLATAVSSTSMRSWASVAVRADNRLDVAHQPGEQVDIVDRLVHEGAAAVEVPGSSPAAGVVVLLGPPPLHVGVAQGEAAEPAACDRFLEPEVGRVNREGKMVQSRTPAASQASMIASQRAG